MWDWTSLQLLTIKAATFVKHRTLRKLASMLAAMALASSVLPVPGGPYSSTPVGGLMPTR